MILTVSVSPASSAQAVSWPEFRALASAAARGGVDAVLFLRGAAPAPFYDPLVVIAALAALDLPVGLGASVPIDFSEPFHVARSFAAVDRLARGRSALVIEIKEGLGVACGHSPLPSDPGARRREFFDVVGKLLDSWQDDALLVDRPRGLFTDPMRVHRINHDGAYYAVRGPLNAPRPLQGAPVIFAPVGTDPALAAAVADVVLLGDGNDVELREHFATGGRAPRVLMDIAPARDAAATAGLMRERFAGGGIDGFNVRVACEPGALDHLGEVAALLGRAPGEGVTLRERLGLARPPSRYAT